MLLELNGNPGETFQLKRVLEQLLPQALREYICKHATLPDSWNRKHLRESDLVLSIDGARTHRWNLVHLRECDAAISDEMSLHQNGQCRLPDGCDPLSLSECACGQVSQTAP